MIVWLYWLNQNDSSLYHRILAGITAVSLWPTISDKSLPRKVFLYKNFSVIYRCFAHHFPQLLSEHKQGDPDSIVAVDKTEMFVEFHRTEKERKEKSNQMQGSSVYKQHFRIILLLQQTLGIIAKERRKQIFEQTNVRLKLAQQKNQDLTLHVRLSRLTLIWNIFQQNLLELGHTKLKFLVQLVFVLTSYYSL